MLNTVKRQKEYIKIGVTSYLNYPYYLIISTTTFKDSSSLTKASILPIDFRLKNRFSESLWIY